MKYILLVFLVCFQLQSAAQNTVYKRFFEDNAAIGGSIYDVYQDRKGFIWLGTESGLIRFDGKSSVLFPASNPFRKAVTNLFEDLKGNIYCQNFSGQFFKTSENKDSLYFVPAISNYGNIKQASIVNDSLIAFIDKGAVSFYNLNTKDIHRVPVSVNELQPTTSKHRKNCYSIVFPSLRQLGCYYPDERKVVKNFRSENVVFYHVHFENNDLILGKTPPFIIENIDTCAITELKEIAANVILTGFTIIDNDIAVLTSNGVYVYDKHLKFKKHYFAKESISSFVKDKQNNYWFGTLNNGLLLVSQPATISLLNNKHFTAVAFKNASLLAGTNNNEIYEISDAPNYPSKLFYKDSTIHEIRDIYYNSVEDELLFSNQQLNILKNNQIRKVVRSINDISAVTSKTYLLSEGASVSFFPLLPSDSLYKIWYLPIDSLYNDRRLALLSENRRTKTAVMMNARKVIAATSNGLLELSPRKQKELFYKK